MNYITWKSASFDGQEVVTIGDDVCDLLKKMALLEMLKIILEGFEDSWMQM